MKKRMRFRIICVLLSFMGLRGFSFLAPDRVLLDQPALVALLRAREKAFCDSLHSLQILLTRLDDDSAATDRAKSSLAGVRVTYKRFSFFLEYFFPAAAKTYNGPARAEMEAPYFEFEDPQGLQEIEAELFLTRPNKGKLLADMEVVTSSAEDLPAFFYHFHPGPDQLMESIHSELVRIMTLYIAGYDAPLLKTGINESAAALQGIETALRTLQPQTKDLTYSLLYRQVETARTFLLRPVGFDKFDRLQFLTGFALPAERTMLRFMQRHGWTKARMPGLDLTAKDLFDGEVVPVAAAGDGALAALGKALFSDRTLSGDGTRACADCHQPAKYYADGLVRNRSSSGSGDLPRNTPTLLYAAYQSAFFWDGRAASLAAQVKAVLLSPDEMHTSPARLELQLNANEKYRALFRMRFSPTDSAGITADEICSALGAYIAGLRPMHSDFDRHMQGDSQAMTAEARAGFNLFLGKAQCGTCHFMPVFNGSTPPFFNKTEFEVLGIPASDDLVHPVPDKDSGRFTNYPLPLNLSSFKTPSVRNSAQTAPYMHNGAFRDLAAVIDFYDKGGGAGIGLIVPNQTLPERNLGLAETEKKQLVAFLEALTDGPPVAASRKPVHQRKTR